MNKSKEFQIRGITVRHDLVLGTAGKQKEFVVLDRLQAISRPGVQSTSSESLFCQW